MRFEKEIQFEDCIKSSRNIARGKVEVSNYPSICGGIGSCPSYEANDLLYIGHGNLDQLKECMSEKKPGGIILGVNNSHYFVDYLNENQIAHVVCQYPALVWSGTFHLCADAVVDGNTYVHENIFYDQNDSALSFPDNARIGPHAYFGKNVTLGDNVSIGANVTIEDNVTIGDNCIIKNSVTICRGSILGNHVILWHGVIIGSEGFGYEQCPEADGIHHVKHPHIGNVVIEDNVEIHANSTVDRAMIGSTRIGAGTKIDNLVQIAHNVSIGKNCVIMAQSGVAGSCVLEDHVAIYGAVSVRDNIRIGSFALVLGKSGVTKNLKGGTMTEWKYYAGMPARESTKRSINWFSEKGINVLIKKAMKNTK